MGNGNTVGMTLLNSMAGTDFKQSMDQHQAWGLKYSDLMDVVIEGHLDACYVRKNARRIWNPVGILAEYAVLSRPQTEQVTTDC